MNTETKRKHTPGPWIAKTVPECWHTTQPKPTTYVECPGPVGNRVVAGVSTVDGAHEWANAKLIAAAPELLEACEAALKAMERRTGLTMANYAKAAERGQTGHAPDIVNGEPDAEKKLRNAINKATK